MITYCIIHLCLLVALVLWLQRYDRANEEAA